MIKRRKQTMFFVEPTDFGWAVRSGEGRLGLFLSQRQALQDVRKRRAELERNGEHSTLVVTGRETESDPRRVAHRPYRPFRN
jgi:hypothetical protein